MRVRFFVGKGGPIERFMRSEVLRHIEPRIAPSAEIVGGAAKAQRRCDSHLHGTSRGRGLSPSRKPTRARVMGFVRAAIEEAPARFFTAWGQPVGTEEDSGRRTCRRRKAPRMRRIGSSFARRHVRRSYEAVTHCAHRRVSSNTRIHPRRSGGRRSPTTVTTS